MQIIIKDPTAPATTGQIGLLNKHGVPVRRDLTKQDASDLITKSLAARRKQRHDDLRNREASPAQIAMISTITRGRYNVTNQLQAEVFFRRLRKAARGRTTAAAAN